MHAREPADCPLRAARRDCGRDLPAAHITCPEQEPQELTDIPAKGCMVTNALLAC
jgi:hypothetical protein